MGVTVVYTAIPPQCALYQRLQKEKPLFLLANRLICNTHTIFDGFFEDESDDLLADFVEEYPKLFKSELDVDMAMAELRSEVLDTCRAYPEVGASASLEKSFQYMEKYLIQAMEQLKIPQSSQVVNRLMFGDKSFSPPRLKEADGLWLVSGKVVEKGAKILRQVDLDTLDFEMDWHREELQSWIDFYILVNKRNEEILVSVW